MSGIRYQPLPTEESSVPATPAELTMVTPPQEQETAAVHGDEATSQQPQPAQMQSMEEAPPSYYAPPSYATSTKLPTYEEAERSKAREATLVIPVVNRSTMPSEPSEALLNRDVLGSDILFLLAFFMAFLFNWLGLMLAFCLSATLAARYGALSGFGLSMIKWFTIMRHTKYVQVHEHYDEWLFWLVIGCGILLFVHGIGQYLRAKFIVGRRERGAGIVIMP